MSAGTGTEQPVPGTEEGTEGTGTGSTGSNTQTNPDGFPKGTPVAEMTPEEQAAYWKFQSRKHEQRNTGWQQVVGDKSAEDLKKDLAELAEIRKSKMTPSEQQIEDAKKQARQEALAEFAPRLAELAFQQALAHVAEADRKELIEDLNLSKFVTEDGGVNMEAVAKTAARIAPVTGGRGSGRGPDFGAGRRTPSKTSAADQGREEAQRRFGKKDKQSA